MLVLSVGCQKQDVPLAQDWSVPGKVTDTMDSLTGGILLYSWHNNVIALQGLNDDSAKVFLFNSSNNSWIQSSLSGTPRGYQWNWPAFDKNSDRVFFEQGYMENNRLKMSVLVGRLTTEANLTLVDTAENKWESDKDAFFGKTASNVQLNDLTGKRDWPELGIGFINGIDMYIPYCLNGHTVISRAAWDGPYSDGVFHTSDSGKTWRIEKILNIHAGGPSICKSSDSYYYFAINPTNSQLLFSRKVVATDGWTSPEPVTRTLGGYYIAVPQDDVVHLCWQDRRHENHRLNLEYPNRGNFEVAYCQRKDSDSEWSRDIILSKGLLYSYAPSMSVAGDKIVVAWAGVQTAKDWHTDFDPNDIYYITSNDGGKTWAKPLRVTDNIKAGITAGDPRVMLLNGVIHLFYIQGKMNLKELSPGLTKLNQPPWPIYYTQRPFPN
jgi:hypothetical protein